MKRIFSAGLALIMALGLLNGLTLPTAAAETPKTGDDGTTNWDFIEPVTHLTEVPNGYTPIYTAQDLADVRKNLSGNYILMADIDLSAWGNWTPIGTDEKEPYCIGTFDGNGYIIRNLKVDMSAVRNDTYAGLFGYCNGVTIRNLGVQGGTVTVSSSVQRVNVCAGGITGLALNLSVVTNCYASVEVSVSSESPHAGGLIGSSFSSSVTNSYHAGIATASSSSSTAYSGGIIGYAGTSVGSSASLQIIGCHNTGKVTAQGKYAYSGGIAGAAHADIRGQLTNCFNTGVVSTVAQHCQLGGVVGSAVSVDMADCYNTRDIEAASYASLSDSSSALYMGGIVGVARGTNIDNSYNTGNLSASAASPYSHLGGIAGYVETSSKSYTVAACYNIGKIALSSSSEYSSAGGIIGTAITQSISREIFIKDCHNAGEVRLFSTSKRSEVGGIAGRTVATTIMNCYYFRK